MSFSQDYVETLKRYQSDRILLLDYVFGESLEELWSNAYVVVQPSTMEGLSIALLEALSYGRCVLLSDIPENVEVAESNAPSFRSRDVSDLREKLEMLLNRPDVVKRYEAQARATHHPALLVGNGSPRARRRALSRSVRRTRWAEMSAPTSSLA
jgi:glycosyltransferase involved in cell wall biosynthesis